MDFNKIKVVIKAANRSSENLASEIGLTGNGLRKTLKNETITLTAFEKLTKVLKIHPAFIFDKEGDPLDYFYKKRPEENQFTMEQMNKLNREIKVLKEQNSKLQGRLLELLDDRKKNRN